MSSTKTFAGISMHVQVTIAPSNVPRYHELMRPVFDAVVAEPECTFFEIYHDPANPGVLKWVENWTKDVKWLMEVLSALRSSTHLAEEAKVAVTDHDLHERLTVYHRTRLQNHTTKSTLKRRRLCGSSLGRWKYSSECQAGAFKRVAIWSHDRCLDTQHALLFVALGKAERATTVDRKGLHSNQDRITGFHRQAIPILQARLCIIRKDPGHPYLKRSSQDRGIRNPRRVACNLITT